MAIFLFRAPSAPHLAETAQQAALPFDRIVESIQELRLAAVERRIDADLACGRHRELVGELESLVARHPLRERFWAQLMLAPYRSGRQGEAPGALERARSGLAEELGVDPSPVLTEVQQGILRQVPGLAPAQPRAALPVIAGRQGRDAESRADEPAAMPARFRRPAVDGRGPAAPGEPGRRPFMTRRPARTGLIPVALVALVAVFVPRILHPGRAEPMSPRTGLNFLDGRTGEVVGHLPVLVTSEVHYAPHPCSPRPENPATRPTMSPDIESPRSPPRILPGMAFPWDTLITAGFTVGGTLGGVWLKGHQDTDLDRRQATQAAEAAQAQKQQAAYTDLVVTARHALRNRRQLRLAYAADTPDEPEVREAFSQSGRHAGKLNRAAATVEIVDSAAARVAVKAVYDNAKEVSEFYQHRSLTLAVVERNVGIPRGTGVIGFDSAEAQRLCDALADAVDSFITAVRPEPTNAGRPSRDTPGIRD